MQRHVFPVLLMSAIGIVSAEAEPLSLTPNRYAQSNVRPPTPAYVAPQAQPAPVAAERAPARYAAANSDVNLGGGFIEFLFSGGRAVAPPRPPSDMYARGEPVEQAVAPVDPRPIDPKFFNQV